MFTYSDSLKYLDSFVNYERTGMGHVKKEFDLGNLRCLLDEMGRPQDAYISVHVSGTKGKGSVSSFTSSIIKKVGYRVGLYTSPHLASPRERIAVDGDIISKDDFARSVESLREYVERSSEPFEWTFFELVTALAMMYFRERAVSYAVFEVGVGGRLDATNVIEPKVAAVTGIGYDHTNILGDTIEKIACEKAAIIKRGMSCISSPQRPEALEVIRKRCAEVGASLGIVGEDIKCEVKSIDASGSEFDIRTPKAAYTSCRTALLGDFQPNNAAAAVGICESLFPEGELSREAVMKGLEEAYIPGRLEVLGRSPLIVIDAAHNGDSIERLKNSVERIFKYDKLIILAGFCQDKDIRDICRILGGLTDNFILTKADVGRAADPYIVRGYLNGKDVAVAGDVKEALGLALSLAGKRDMIPATGSFCVIGEVRKLLVGGVD
jgi:dihydrofolate synthase/folylpolyglutamate synthase